MWVGLADGTVCQLRLGEGTACRWMAAKDTTFMFGQRSLR